MANLRVKAELANANEMDKFPPVFQKSRPTELKWIFDQSNLDSAGELNYSSGSSDWPDSSDTTFDWPQDEHHEPVNAANVCTIHSIKPNDETSNTTFNRQCDEIDMNNRCQDKPIEEADASLSNPDCALEIDELHKDRLEEDLNQASSNSPNNSLGNSTRIEPISVETSHQETRRSAIKPKSHMIKRLASESGDLLAKEKLAERFEAMQIDNNPNPFITVSAFTGDSLNAYPQVMQQHMPWSNASSSSYNHGLPNTLLPPLSGMIVANSFHSYSQYSGPRSRRSSFSSNEASDFGGNPDYNRKKEDDKRSRNREAARRCRKRKLERIEKLKSEKERAEEEFSKTDKLLAQFKCQNQSLWRLVYQHLKIGCTALEFLRR